MRILRPPFAPLLVALSFLTILPVGIAHATDREISRSRAWYPLVGLLYGAMLVAIAALADLLSLRPLLTAALLTAALAVANRFLHLDGLMDICDGLWGGQTPARRLEIMRDSRVGAFAVAGAATILLLKYSALATLLDGPLLDSAGPDGAGLDGTPLDSAGLDGALLDGAGLDGALLDGAGLDGKGAIWHALLFFPTASRWTMTLLLTAFPYGRPQGIGAAFAAAGRPWLATGWALLTALIIAAATGGLAGALILAALSALALLFGWTASRQLGGGLTGDCYGAANEIAETAALIALAAIARHPWFAPLWFAHL